MENYESQKYFGKETFQELEYIGSKGMDVCLEEFIMKLIWCPAQIGKQLLV